MGQKRKHTRRQRSLSTPVHSPVRGVQHRRRELILLALGILALATGLVGHHALRGAGRLVGGHG